MTEYRQTRYKLPKGAVDLMLIRHGESEAATADKLFPLSADGHGDPALHPEGHRQAEAVADRLEHEHFDALYVTSLRRTAQTAAPLAKRLGMTPEVEADLREVHLGEWDRGLYRIKLAERDPLFQESLKAQEWGIIPGAETNEQLQTRIRAALDRLEANHADERIAAFVHGGVIGTIIAMATGSRAMAFLGAANGSISRVVLHKGTMRVRGFNDVSHLAEWQ